MPGMTFAPEAAVDLARECLYRFLAAALSEPGPPSYRLLHDAENQRLASAAADLLRAEAAADTVPLGFGELPPDQLNLGPLLRALPGSLDEQRAEYDRVFGLVYTRECPPYETEYLASSEPFFRSQHLADVAGFYAAFGLETARAAPERPDHVALELEFMAFVLQKKRLAWAAPEENPETLERASVSEEVERKFFQDHLAWWLPSFVTGLRRKAESGFYATVAAALAALLPAERSRLGAPPPRLPLQPALIERSEEQSGCAGCAGPM